MNVIRSKQNPNNDLLDETSEGLNLYFVQNALDFLKSGCYHVIRTAFFRVTMKTHVDADRREIYDRKCEKNMSVVQYDPDFTETPNIDSILISTLPKRKLIRLIENCEMSADLKALLITMSDTAIMIGEKLIPIGRAVLSVAISLAKMFPTLALTVILAKFLPVLASLGIVKLALAKLLALILPLLGAYQDIKDAILNNSLRVASEEMSKVFRTPSEI